jgi:DNA-directed RNA polymerase subunit RPC12/RpoP
MKGVKKGSIRGTYKKYTDDEIIDVLSKYESIKDLRAGDDLNFYYLSKRRGLSEYLPARRTKAMNLVGSSLERTIASKEERAKEIKNLKEQDKSNKKERKESRGHRAKMLFRSEKIDDETIYCGRCLKETEKKDISKHNKNLCRKCYSRYLYLTKIGQDTNPHNIKDEYCHITINHNEKVFHIGIFADKRVEDYLTKIGYYFIFKSRTR